MTGAAVIGDIGMRRQKSTDWYNEDIFDVSKINGDWGGKSYG